MLETAVKLHTSAYVSIRAPAYASICVHLMLEAAVKLRHIKRFILISIDCDIVASYTSVSCLRGKDGVTLLFLQF
jgi:hypothetical protein